MSYVSQVLGGSTATKFIYNAFTVAGWAGDSSSGVPFTARGSVSGALTANALADLLNESGSAGQIDHFQIFTNDATSRTIRVVITVDGTQILDVTSGTISTTSTGGCWAGSTRSTAIALPLPPIKYTNSIRLQYASNQNETGKFTLGLAYQKVT